jgi:hypothetical protein
MKKTNNFPFRLVVSFETSTNLPMIFGCLLLGIGLLRRRCQGLGILTIYYYLYTSREARSSASQRCA